MHIILLIAQEDKCFHQERPPFSSPLLHPPAFGGSEVGQVEEMALMLCQHYSATAETLV